MPRAPLAPEERDLRIELMAAIHQEMGRRGMTIAQAAEFLGVHPPDVSYLVNRHAERHSLSLLLTWARSFDLNCKLSLTLA